MWLSSSNYACGLKKKKVTLREHPIVYLQPVELHDNSNDERKSQILDNVQFSDVIILNLLPHASS